MRITVDTNLVVYFPVGDMALRDNRDNGDQHENDETVGNDDNVLQLCVRVHTGTSYGNRGEPSFWNSFVIVFPSNSTADFYYSVISP